MSYAQALEQQLGLMRALHGPDLQGYAVETMGCAESASAYLQVVHDAAETGDPYYWSPEICGVIAGVWREMPEWTLRREVLGSPAGFFWFATPFGVPCPSAEHPGETDVLVGLLWGVDDTLVANGSVGTAWVIPVYPTEYGSLGTGKLIPWGLNWTRTYTAEQWPVGGPLRAHNEVILRIFSACLAFIEQRILVTPRQAAPRATRKRVQARLGHEPLVRVVQLRRAQTTRPSGEPSGEPVAWSCRWVVSGHWRQQYYPSTDEHRPIFILPYVKGPDDKPLKRPRAQVFAVVR